jgi:hypothetical protein
MIVMMTMQPMIWTVRQCCASYQHNHDLWRGLLQHSSLYKTKSFVALRRLHRQCDYSGPASVSGPIPEYDARTTSRFKPVADVDRLLPIEGRQANLKKRYLAMAAIQRTYYQRRLDNNRTIFLLHRVKTRQRAFEREVSRDLHTTWHRGCPQDG